MADIESLYSLLKERRLRWLGHVRRIEDGRIPKDLLYGELTIGQRSQGRPQQYFRNVCKRDLRDCEIDVQEWEALAEDRDEWRLSVKTGIVNSRRDEAEEKRQRRKERTTDCQSCHSPNQDFVCALCRRDFHELACTATAGSAHCPTQLPHRLHFRPTLVPTVETCLGHGLGSILYSHLRTHHHRYVDWDGGGDR